VHGRMEAELGSHFFDGTVFIIVIFDQIVIFYQIVIFEQIVMFDQIVVFDQIVMFGQIVMFDQIVMIDQIVNVCDQYHNATHTFLKSLVINASLTFCHFHF
jgi:hypothetical protein